MDDQLLAPPPAKSFQHRAERLRVAVHLRLHARGVCPQFWLDVRFPLEVRGHDQYQRATIAICRCASHRNYQRRCCRRAGHTSPSRRSFYHCWKTALVFHLVQFHWCNESGGLNRIAKLFRSAYHHVACCRERIRRIYSAGDSIMMWRLRIFTE